MRTGLCMRAFVRVRVCFTVPSASISAHVCVCVVGCVERLCTYASALCGRCGGTAGTGGINSLAGGRALVVSVRCHRPVSRALGPQVSRGDAVPSRRSGLADMGTRPWSTPPAPSTSSAATTATPPTRTCGRAPTEVRGPDSVGGWSVGYYGGYYKGTSGVLWGTNWSYCRGLVLRGY